MGECLLGLATYLVSPSFLPPPLPTCLRELARLLRAGEGAEDFSSRLFKPCIVPKVGPAFCRGDGT